MQTERRAPRKATKPSDLKSPTARMKLDKRPKPYFATIARGIYLGYRRTQNDIGSWSVRVAFKGTKEWVSPIGLADDKETANPPHSFSFDQAADEARRIARRQPAKIEGVSSTVGKPVTVDEALTRYDAHQKVRGQAGIGGKRTRKHVAALLGRPIAVLKANDYSDWVHGLIAGGMKLSTLNRVMNNFRAALNLAAKGDPMIDRAAIRDGLAVIEDDGEARNVILTNEQVTSVVLGSYDYHQRLGIFVEVIAATGARPSQVGRLEVRDLIMTDPTRPKLNMPKSAKGHTAKARAKKSKREPIEITTSLAAKLRREAAGRPGNAPLLLKVKGGAWGGNPYEAYHNMFQAVLERVGLETNDEGERVTIYALRHTSIVRLLLKGIDVYFVALKHDTSVQQIKDNYAKRIGHHTDDIMRRALVDFTPSPIRRVA